MGKSNLQLRKPMTPCERGNWVDTEGYVDILGRAIEVTQEDRTPLDDYCEGAKRDSVPCKVRYLRTLNEYRAVVGGYENMAKEIALIQPCIRTPKRLKQIEAFKQELSRPRIHTKRQIIRARQILGISPPEKIFVPRPWRVGLKYRKRKR